MLLRMQEAAECTMFIHILITAAALISLLISLVYSIYSASSLFFFAAFLPVQITREGIDFGSVITDGSVDRNQKFFPGPTKPLLMQLS